VQYANKLTTPPSWKTFFLIGKKAVLKVCLFVVGQDSEYGYTVLVFLQRISLFTTSLLKYFWKKFLPSFATDGLYIEKATNATGEKNEQIYKFRQ
jgi:hypothetical protein